MLQSFSPDFDNAKRNWRAAFVTTLKDLIVKVRFEAQQARAKAADSGGAGGCGAASLVAGVRHEAYAYPTAEAIDAARARARKADEVALELAEVKIPEVKVKIEVAKQAQDAAIELGRDPEAKRKFGKDVLRERTAAAKKALTAVQRELLALEAKADQLAREKERNTEMREREEVAFARIGAEGLWGLRVTPCFDEDPLIEKAAGAVKKLSDEEEKTLRAKEVLESVRKKKEAEETAARLEEAKGASGSGDGSGGGGGGSVARLTAKLDFMQSLDATVDRASSPRAPASGRKAPGRLLGGDGNSGLASPGGGSGSGGAGTPGGDRPRVGRLFASPVPVPGGPPTPGSGALARRSGGGSRIGDLAARFDGLGSGGGSGGGSDGDGAPFANGGFGLAPPPDSPPRRASFFAKPSLSSPRPAALASSSSGSSGGGGNHRIRDYMEQAADSAEQEKMFQKQVGTPRKAPSRASLASPTPSGGGAPESASKATPRRFAKYAV